ncbi:MAG: hypothetical protein ACR2OC_02200 [Solirubrobacterales bacterium]
MGISEDRPGQPGQQEAYYPPPAEGRVEWATEGLGARVNEIVDAVEREAAKLRQEAESEAAQVRYQAQEEARRYVDQARHQAESLVARRMERIQEISDVLMARAEEVLERLDYAVPVKTGFENLVRALGETAERLANQDYSEFAEPSWDEVRSAPAQQTPEPPYSPQSATGAPPPQPGYASPATATGYAADPAGSPPQPPQPPPVEYANPSGPPPQVPLPQGAGPGWQELDGAHRIAIQMAAAGSTRGEVEAHLVHAPEPARASVLDEIFGPGSPAETRVPWATPPGGGQPA